MTLLVAHHCYSRMYSTYKELFIMYTKTSSAKLSISCIMGTRQYISTFFCKYLYITQRKCSHFIEFTNIFPLSLLPKVGLVSI